MDDRNGNLYPDHAAARRAGVPAKHIQQIAVRVYAKGPFKGRRYVLNDDGTQGRRLHPDASKAEINAWLEQQAAARR